jgi:hypothetical protein
MNDTNDNNEGGVVCLTPGVRRLVLAGWREMHGMRGSTLGRCARFDGAKEPDKGVEAEAKKEAVDDE